MTIPHFTDTSSSRWVVVRGESMSRFIAHAGPVSYAAPAEAEHVSGSVLLDGVDEFSEPGVFLG